MTAKDIAANPTYKFNNLSIARAAGRKGGASKSKKKSHAAKFRSLRELAARNGLDISKHKDWIVSMILDPDRMSTDILDKLTTFMREIKGKGNDELYQKLLTTYNTTYANIHKQNVNLTQVNINNEKETNEEIDAFISKVVMDEDK